MLLTPLLTNKRQTASRLMRQVPPQVTVAPLRRKQILIQDDEPNAFGLPTISHETTPHTHNPLFLMQGDVSMTTRRETT